MGHIWSRGCVLSALLLVGTLSGMMGAGSGKAFAQKPPQAASVATPPGPDIATIDAQRGAFDRFLDAHPEIEEAVINSPNVVSNSGYLHRYPELEAFLDNHPLVKADPRAFVSPQASSRRVGAGSGNFAPFVVFLCLLLAFLWYRTVVENRRWNQSFKMQQELHAVLVGKVASGQDSGADLQSDAVRRWLESRGWTNPVGRILGSLQAGVVLLLLAVGLFVARVQMGGNGFTPLLALGTLGMALGVGFIVSALISYRLSQHLGLITPITPATDTTVKH